MGVRSLINRGPKQGVHPGRRRAGRLLSLPPWVKDVRARAGGVLITQFERWQTLKINSAAAVTERDVGELEVMARKHGGAG